MSTAELMSRRNGINQRFNLWILERVRQRRGSPELPFTLEYRHIYVMPTMFGFRFGILLEWKVIFFRDQDVSVDEHVAFGARFGELEIHPFTPNLESHPEVVVIHHGPESKRGQNNWHSDVTWRLEPSLGSILRARIVPPVIS